MPAQHIHPRVRMFLDNRDRALARGDGGVVRSMDAELRRLGVSDDATLANPTGEALPIPSVSKSKTGLKLPRCEHENVADRCPVCNPELEAK
jgi:hypothetical protein